MALSARKLPGHTNIVAAAAVAAHVDLLQQQDICVRRCERCLDGFELVATFDVPLQHPQWAARGERGVGGAGVAAAVVDMHQLAGAGQGGVVAAELEELALRLLCKSPSTGGLYADRGLQGVRIHYAGMRAPRGNTGCSYKRQY